MKKTTSATKAVRLAREQLRAAIDRACIARGEAQWTAGYRAAASYPKGPMAPGEHDRLYRKEMEQFRYCGIAERTAERAMRKYARAVASAVAKRKR